ncbi:hypothetical protein VP01_3547g1 [Puccinia sorghi]|uniref:Uncharacterized protein n=1 Tax=Puccinia sorghi TaxID=27349 RepID=A0A0L6UVE6_9BASI|nr:hypothetical protein VP01_3547g1 [Puccinia sorghi]
MKLVSTLNGWYSLSNFFVSSGSHRVHSSKSNGFCTPCNQANEQGILVNSYNPPFTPAKVPLVYGKFHYLKLSIPPNFKNTWAMGVSLYGNERVIEMDFDSGNSSRSYECLLSLSICARSLLYFLKFEFYSPSTHIFIFKNQRYMDNEELGMIKQFFFSRTFTKMNLMMIDVPKGNTIKPVDFQKFPIIPPPSILILKITKHYSWAHLWISVSILIHKKYIFLASFRRIKKEQHLEFHENIKQPMKKIRKNDHQKNLNNSYNVVEVEFGRVQTVSQVEMGFIGLITNEKETLHIHTQICLYTTSHVIYFYFIYVVSVVRHMVDDPH